MLVILKSARTGIVLPRRERIEEEPKGGLNAFSLSGIGIGGVIGAGFFLGSGLAVREAGPAVSLAFLLGGLIMMQVLGAMASINVNRLQPGSFRVYAEQFLGPYTGFLLGWVMFTSSILGIGSEAIAMGVFVHLWLPHLPLPVLATSFTVIIILLNMMNMRFFGRIEAGMAAVKVLALLAFIIVGCYVLVTRGAPQVPSPLSGWHSFFPMGVSGILQSMLVVIFSYSGIGAVAMAAREVNRPRIEIPEASRIMSFGSIGLYAISMLVLVMITPWHSVSLKKSPFVHAFDVIGLEWGAAALNIVVLLAAFSVMAAAYYASIQMIVSLSVVKKGPRFFLQHSRNGFYRNAWIAVAAGVLIVVGISFLLPSTLYNYLVSASSYFTFLNWTINLIVYVIWKKRRGENETYESKLIWGRPGAYGSIIAILFLFVISLKVHDFRMGFYAAFALAAVISIAYRIWSRGPRRDPRTR
ncbi:amino acid permease [Neobacillus terrae]|uniref:amino acid permease n=1 Tax=Neobacillus terrae TaxID=3034837 RepID=UPI003083AC62